MSGGLDQWSGTTHVSRSGTNLSLGASMCCGSARNAFIDRSEDSHDLSFLKYDYLTSRRRLQSVSPIFLYSTPSPKYPASFHAFIVGPSYGP